MISIGLFSTHLPYIILAMVYGVYFGINSIMKMEMQADQEEKIISVDIKKGTNDNSSNTCYYLEWLAEVEGECGCDLQHGIQLTNRDYHQFKPPRSWISFDLFSRPPPCLG